MEQEYKLKKERWKREMAEVDTPKRQREAVLSQHKENYKEMEATETQRMARNQKEVLDREVRKFRRRRLVKYHDLEQDLLREVNRKKRPQLLFNLNYVNVMYLPFFAGTQQAPIATRIRSYNAHASSRTNSRS